MDLLWIALFIAATGGLWWLSSKIEPHYASRDGTRFVANAQEIIDGRPIGRMRETRVAVRPDGLLLCSQKKALRRKGVDFMLIGTSATPPRKLKVYLAHEVADGMTSSASELAIRVPERSRVIAVLDEILARRALRQPKPPGTP